MLRAVLSSTLVPLLVAIGTPAALAGGPPPTVIGGFADDCLSASVPFNLHDRFVREDTATFSDGNPGAGSDFGTAALTFGGVGQANAFFADADHPGTGLHTYAATFDGGALPAWLVFASPVGAATPGNLATTVGGPPQSATGPHVIAISATDPDSGSATYTFTLHVLAVNDAPAVGAALLSMAVNEDSTLTSPNPAQQVALSDAEGNVLTYSAVEQGQATLPSFLAFTPATRRFTVPTAPTNSQVRAYTIAYTATDNGTSGVQCSTLLASDARSGGGNFTFTVNNTNDPPLVYNPIADQAANEDAVFSLQVPFSAAGFNAAVSALDDQDRLNVAETLTWTATVDTGGGPVDVTDGACGVSCPWLTFNSVTRSFSGTPRQANVSPPNTVARVRLTDGSAAFAEDTFQVDIDNVDDDPVLAAQIPDRDGTEDSAFAFTFAADAFTDEDVAAGLQTLTYVAAITACPSSYDGNDDGIGGDACPSGASLGWLTFTQAGTDRSFGGTPDNGDVGVWAVQITASDGAGPTAADTFAITVANTNDPPALLNPLADAVTDEAAPYLRAIPATTFGDVDLLHTLDPPTFAAFYEAPLGSGNYLPIPPSGSPIWLTFDAGASAYDGSQVLAGTPLDADAGLWRIRVRVTDGLGAGALDTFDLTVSDLPEADVAVSIDNGRDHVEAGDALLYALIVGNQGSTTLTGVAVSNTLDPQLVDVQWVCAASAGSACPDPPTGIGAVAALVDVAVGGEVRFDVAADVSPAAPGGFLSSSAGGTPPAGFVDEDPGDNTDVDTDEVGATLRDGFEAD